jgi:hypothetical protein
MKTRISFAAILAFASLAGGQVVQTTGTDCSKFVGGDAGSEISGCISAAEEGQYDARSIVGTQSINGTTLIAFATAAALDDALESSEPLKSPCWRDDPISQLVTRAHDPYRHDLACDL